PAHIPDRSGRPPFRIGRWTSRVRGLPEVFGDLPVASLADEIETPGDGQVRAVITVAGNPVLSTPNGARLDRAFAALDSMVSVDPYLNATTRHADVILPPPGALQRSHYDAAFYGLSVRNVANYTPAVTAKDPDTPDEWEILLRLGAIAAGQGADADVAAFDHLVAATVAHRVTSSAGSPVHGRDAEELLAAVGHRRGPDRLVDLLLRSGPYGDHFNGGGDGLSLDLLLDHPHGIDLGPLEPRVPGNLTTASGAIELAPEPILADLERVRTTLAQEPAELVLVGRRHLRTNNSWMHNVPMLNKGRDLCCLQIHPEDASHFGLVDGADAEVSSIAGSIVVPVEVTEDIAPGVVSIPHGFGHDLDGVRLRVAVERPGRNSNLLTPETDLDALSGTAVLNGIPVTVRPAP
ncbi:MAG: molybdopterin dinucleotide binding domain-containing protein, partial [Nitriliruptorales bacterium]